MKNSLFTCFLLWFFVGSAWAQVTDSLTFRVQPLIVPTTLAVGSLVVQGKISRQLQQQVVSQYPGGYSTSADAYLQYAPLAVSLGLGAAGVKGRYPFREQVVLAVLSNVAALGVTYTIKKIARYPRPDGSDYDAYPSGHATRAFTAATLLHKEYGPRSAWYSVGGYGVATATGTLRILENQHWLSDVLAGAAVGIGATEVVYMGYPWVKKKLKKKKR